MKKYDDERKYDDDEINIDDILFCVYREYW